MESHIIFNFFFPNKKKTKEQTLWPPTAKKLQGYTLYSD